MKNRYNLKMRPTPTYYLVEWPKQETLHFSSNVSF